MEVDGHCVPFNPEATRWIGVWIDPGLYLKAQEDATCRDYDLRETIQYIFFECRKWRHQRNKLYKDLEIDGIMKPAAAEEHSQGRLLGEPRATRALLQFLASVTELSWDNGTSTHLFYVGSYRRE